MLAGRWSPVAKEVCKHSNSPGSVEEGKKVMCGACEGSVNEGWVGSSSEHRASRSSVEGAARDLGMKFERLLWYGDGRGEGIKEWGLVTDAGSVAFTQNRKDGLKVSRRNCFSRKVANTIQMRIIPHGKVLLIHDL